MQLRDYQINSANWLESEWQRGVHRSVVVKPTGAGKTLFAVEGIIRPAVESDKVVWFVVPRKQLVHQTSKVLDEACLYDHGVMQGQHKRKRPYASIQVCSQQTLVNRIGKESRRPDIIIFDECHHVTDENSLGKVITSFPQAKMVGLTATPCRYDGKGLGRVFQSMFVATTYPELVQQGWLLPYELYGPQEEVDTSGIDVQAGDYNQKQAGQKIDTEKLVGDIVLNWIEHAKGLRTIVFAQNVDHSKHICEKFNAAGVPWAHIDHKTPQAERDDSLAKLESGELTGLSSVGVFTEGFDMPSVQCIVLARLTKSKSLYMQMPGRGARPEFKTARPGEFFTILDHASCYKEHGLFDDPALHQWSLNDSFIPKREGGGQERQAPIKVCIACHWIGRTDQLSCPKCGEVLPVPENAEQLDFVEDDRILVKIKSLVPAEVVAGVEEPPKEPPPAPLEERQKYYRYCVMTARSRANKPISANVRFKAKFGQWPQKEDRLASTVTVEVDTAGDQKVWYFHEWAVCKRCGTRREKSMAMCPTCVEDLMEIKTPLTDEQMDMFPFLDSDWKENERKRHEKWVAKGIV